MRVEVLTDRPAERFAVGARLLREGVSEALTIVESRPADPGWVIRFREVRSRDAAEGFRLAYLEVEAGPGDVLPRGTYYWHEIVGAVVRDLEGRALGTVRDVYRTGGADVLEVTGGPRGDFDLPIVRPFVRIFAPRRGEIVADAGALDLPAAGSIAPPPPPRPPRPRRATRRRPAVPVTPRPAPPAAGQEAAGTPADGTTSDPMVAGTSSPAPGAADGAAEAAPGDARTA